MEHQYPGPVGGDEYMLAELMLPDQAHVRSQDWTIFFLHEDAVPEEESTQRPKRKRRRKRRTALLDEDEDTEPRSENGDKVIDDTEMSDDSNFEDEAESVDGPPLVYVLNLVNTKQDQTVKRGAIVKAMAICTRHSFLHIFKPLLLLALQEYFTSPTRDTLAALYDAVNGMDLSLVPKLSWHEKFILQSSEAKDLFLGKFEAMIEQRMAAEQAQDQRQVHCPPSSIPPQQRARFGLPRDTHEFETVVKYVNVPVPIKVPVALSPETVGDFSLVKLISTFATPHAATPVPFQPTHPHLTTSGANTHPIIVLLNALLTQKRVIFLGHNLPSSDVAEAVLGACALASGGLLRGFTRHAFPYTDLTKVEDLLRVPGFIAGVTNPAFAHKTEWWDLLCDLSTGRIKISNRIEQVPLSEGVAFFQTHSNLLNSGASTHGISAIVGAGASLSAGIGGSLASNNPSGDASGDAAFMSNVMQAINERHGENAIRLKFRRWILKFTRVAAAFEETVYGATSLQVQPSVRSPPPQQHLSPTKDASALEADLPTTHGYVWTTPQARTLELAANANRIEGWRTTRSYYNFVQDLAIQHAHQPVQTLDLYHLHDKLAKLRLNAEHSASIYLAICHAVQTDAEISQLLAVISGGVGDWAGSSTVSGTGNSATSSSSSSSAPANGLFYLALGLFHQRREVREAVALLLERVQGHEAGGHFWGWLGKFARVGWERVMGGIEGRGGDEDEEGEEGGGGGGG